MCQSCDWELLLNTIDAMRCDRERPTFGSNGVPEGNRSISSRRNGGYRWADDVLAGIARNVLKRRHATDNQREAVYNIKEGKGNHGSRADHRPSKPRRIYIPNH